MPKDVNGVLFRNALGGYNKEDVNKYIKEISEGVSVREREYAEKLSRETRRAEEEKEKADVMARKLDEVAIEAYSEMQAARETEKRLADLEKKLAEYSAMLDELACEAYKSESAKKTLEEEIKCREENPVGTLADASLETRISKLERDVSEAIAKFSSVKDGACQRKEKGFGIEGLLEEIIKAAFCRRDNGKGKKK